MAYETTVKLKEVTDLGREFNLVAMVGTMRLDMNVEKKDRLRINVGDTIKFDAEFNRGGVHVKSEVEFIRDGKTYAIRPVTVNQSGGPA